MAHNVEWKARVSDPHRQRKLAEQLAGSPPELLEQLDTFFPVSHGRLKVRRFAPNSGELIHYHRPNQLGPKLSTYSLVRTDQPDALRDLLSASLGVLGEVRKQRWLYLVGQTRIHFDEVAELGTFLEVEVVLRPEQSLLEGEQLADQLRRALAIRDEDLVAVAYLDLILGSKERLDRK